jgi:hypothetical protein
VFERGDVVVGQDLGEAVAPIHRQDGGEGVELQRPAGFGIGGREGKVRHGRGLALDFARGRFRRHG